MEKALGDYIKEQRKAGYSEPDIKKSCLDAGWPRQIVIQALGESDIVIPDKKSVGSEMQMTHTLFTPHFNSSLVIFFHIGVVLLGGLVVMAGIVSFDLSEYSFFEAISIVLTGILLLCIGVWRILERRRILKQLRVNTYPKKPKGFAYQLLSISSDIFIMGVGVYGTYVSISTNEGLEVLVIPPVGVTLCIMGAVSIINIVRNK